MSTTEDNLNTSSTKTKESEKELRRLEWQKKLADQKQAAQSDVEPKLMSKAELKAQRRQQQEAQRQQKLETKTTKTPQTSTTISKDFTSCKLSTSDVKGALQKQSTNSSSADIKVKTAPPKKTITNHHKNRKVNLVSHLYVDSNLMDTPSMNNVHPIFIRLAVQHKTRTVFGSNARCVSLLVALRSLIADIKCPPHMEFCRYCETIVDACIAHLNRCRPLSVSMNNALRYFKLQLTQEATKLNDSEKVTYLTNLISTYIVDQIEKAGEAISLSVNGKITQCGDVILTFSCSSLVKKILLDAQKVGKNFRVIIVDGRPLNSGRQMAQQLCTAGIRCTYVQMNALSHVVRQCTKVLLGSYALLANGYVMARMGTAQVALVAHTFNKPVLVCCETYKFTERIQTDAFVCNEIGNDYDLLMEIGPHKTSPLLTNDSGQSRREHSTSNPAVLNLLYDVTPSDLVTAIVTELAILPCSSVPVVLRIRPTELI